MRLTSCEKRLDPRRRSCGSISWRYLGASEVHPGWLLESSTNGLAFAWRGDSPPRPGTLVEMVDDQAEPGCAIVRRVAPCHEDLSVIALERVMGGPFPARLTHAPPSYPGWVLGPEAEPKPHRRAASAQLALDLAFNSSLLNSAELAG